MLKSTAAMCICQCKCFRLALSVSFPRLTGACTATSSHKLICFLHVSCWWSTALATTLGSREERNNWRPFFLAKQPYCWEGDSPCQSSYSPDRVVWTFEMSIATCTLMVEGYWAVDIFDIGNHRKLSQVWHLLDSASVFLMHGEAYKEPRKIIILPPLVYEDSQVQDEQGRFVSSLWIIIRKARCGSKYQP